MGVEGCSSCLDLQAVGRRLVAVHALALPGELLLLRCIAIPCFRCCAAAAILAAIVSRCRAVAAAAFVLRLCQPLVVQEATTWV
jgi:hypothetical protein